MEFGFFKKKKKILLIGTGFLSQVLQENLKIKYFFPRFHYQKLNIRSKKQVFKILEKELYEGSNLYY